MSETKLRQQRRGDERLMLTCLVVERLCAQRVPASVRLEAEIGRVDTQMLVVQPPESRGRALGSDREARRTAGPRRNGERVYARSHERRQLDYAELLREARRRRRTSDRSLFGVERHLEARDAVYAADQDRRTDRRCLEDEGCILSRDPNAAVTGGLVGNDGEGVDREPAMEVERVRQPDVIGARPASSDATGHGETSCGRRQRRSCRRVHDASNRAPRDD